MSVTDKTTAVALGTFDGLHLAHRKVLENALHCPTAKSAVCVTFSCPPALFKDRRNGILMQPQLKEEKLLQMGFKQVITLDFEKVKDMPPRDFLQRLRKNCNSVAFCCGYDYSFGKNGSGNVELIKDFCKETGTEVIVENPYKLGNELVSSTAIRNYIANGNISRANELLGHPLQFMGPVINGDKRGRTIGYPTVNQELPDLFVTPKFGVYETTVTVDNKKYTGITNIGIRPTYRLEKPLCETHILDYCGDLYGKSILIELNRFIRSEKKFSSLEELKQAINTDYDFIKGGDRCDINNKP